MAALADHWPLFNLRVRSERLELRVPTDDDVAELAMLAAEGIHDPDVMPFSNAWTDGPAPEVRRSVCQWLWKQRADWTAESWCLGFAIVHDGVVMGLQDVRGEKFGLRGEIATGSWLGRAHQGRGFGREMRAAVLAFAFDHLGAREATTSAFTDNAASNAVSRGLGYAADGEDVVVVRDVAARLVRYRMTRERWRERERAEVQVENLEPCLPLMGIPGGRPAAS